MEQYKYVIVGNSAGGIAGARAIRKADASGKILILSEERYPAYSRPLIAKHLSEGKSVDRMRLAPPTFYDEMQLDVRLGTKAVGLDCAAHLLRTDEQIGFVHGEALHGPVAETAKTSDSSSARIALFATGLLSWGKSRSMSGHTTRARSALPG